MAENGSPRPSWHLAGVLPRGGAGRGDRPDLLETTASRAGASAGLYGLATKMWGSLRGDRVRGDAKGPLLLSSVRPWPLRAQTSLVRDQAQGARGSVPSAARGARPLVRPWPLRAQMSLLRDQAQEARGSVPSAARGARPAEGPCRASGGQLSRGFSALLFRLKLRDQMFLTTGPCPTLPRMG